jgi:diguanylate cyclase (GGDEF)-like protein
MFGSKKRIFHSKLSLKLLRSIILISGSITLITSTVQLYIDYRAGIDALNHQVAKLGAMYDNSLVRSVWELNHPATENILDLIFDNQALSALQLDTYDDEGKLDKVYIRGDVQTNQGFEYEFPLYFHLNGKSHLTAELKVVADKQVVLDKVYASIFIVLLSQAIKTFIVSFILLLIFHQLIVRHINQLVEWLNTYSQQKIFSPLIDNRAKHQQDEIFDLKTSLNAMGKSLYEHSQILEKSVVQRTSELTKRSQELEATQEQLHKILWEKEQQLALVADAKSDYLWELDVFGNVSKLSASLLELLGIDFDFSLPTRIPAALNITDTAKAAMIEQAISQRLGIDPINFQLFDVNNKVVWISLMAKPAFDEQGSFLGYHGIASNITAQKHLETLAYTDSLTGMANRVAFFHRAKTELHRAKRLDYLVGVMMLDLDYFKQINDSYGHEAGDHVLKRVAQALAHCIREEDLVARIGGEEFSIIIPNADKSGLHQLATRLQKQIAALDFDFLTHHKGVTVSIGYTVVGGLETFSEALKRADQHLYRAKANGRNCFVSDAELKQA